MQVRHGKNLNKDTANGHRKEAKDGRDHSEEKSRGLRDVLGWIWGKKIWGKKKSFAISLLNSHTYGLLKQSLKMF